MCPQEVTKGRIVEHRMRWLRSRLPGPLTSSHLQLAALTRNRCNANHNAVCLPWQHGVSTRTVLSTSASRSGGPTRVRCAVSPFRMFGSTARGQAVRVPQPHGCIVLTYIDSPFAVIAPQRSVRYALAPAGVAHEQHSKRLIGEHDDDGVFVRVVLAVGEECAAGREHRERHAVVGCPPVAAAGDVDRNVMEALLAQAVVERASAVLLPAARDRIDPKRAHDRRESTNVIAVGNLST